ncbi:branched-chain amino acid ABC transporter permease [Effusibacillus lacus]|uniref:Branched-chain amino acid ABC n=1 Tax=Effusibacillus lacus TaxID=1348429 RepID=A0A292YII5_9BACL|nr:branched-chain amino acid ABC transporter permease [Effusibacillus lacus]TCS72564.1 amino acid/amide ABC transporter membrane protein 2 (HAAT family) [Effusibacillus lacus]GAX90877.1 branched-chain amino acid ABC [Effusibacillus lacus]
MNKKLLAGLCLLFFVAFPIVFPDDYFIHILVMGGINVVLVLSLNLISGFAGQVSLGHAAFFGIGAYASAILSMNGIPVWVAFVLAAVISAVSGFLIGYPVLRLRGHFFAIATLGFGEIVHLLINNWVDVTRGPMGLSGIPKPEAIFGLDFSSKTHYYFLILAFTVSAIYFSTRIQQSKMGRALVSIRTDEITASAMGVNVAYYKILAFTFSSAIAGIAGAYYAHFVLFLSPETFKLAMSINVLLMLLIGGMGSILGSVLGGLFITIVSEYLRTFAQYQMLIYGVLIVMVVIFAPKGLSGVLEKVSGFLRKTVFQKSQMKGGYSAHEPTHSAD